MKSFTSINVKLKSKKLDTIDKCEYNKTKKGGEM